MNDYVQPIPMADTGDLFEGGDCTISGWGDTDGEKGTSPNNLQKLKVKPFSKLFSKPFSKHH